MKWFWKTNYFITIYLILILFIYLIYFIEVGTEFYAITKWFKIFIKILTFNGTLEMISMIIEWIQFPLCLFVLIFRKNERTKIHLFYLIFLVFSNLFKWVLWFLAVGATT